MSTNSFKKQAISKQFQCRQNYYSKTTKNKDKTNNFPTRLVVPAINFTVAFHKLGYIGIKKIFDNENINYSKSNHTRKQS